eukprot:TRINITY_DN16604_c0_g1_i1.p1 TRINITY_DN16604_c0_g1~~TRINITY_DN16604_c0_g1_i1.p1  ORF type:complete len:475 (+),score=37.63 TRINITY_DN16604_c0_g1_i1:40-1425(+)
MPEVTYTVTAKRWLVLAIFCLCLLVNSACWVTYSQITNEAAIYYEVSTVWVDILSMIFMFWYLPVNFPACWILEKWGLRMGLLLGSGLGCVGAGLRILGRSNKSFPAVVVGQSLIAIGQPFLLNSPAKLSSVWFPDSERALATVIGSSSQLIGSAMGFVVPPIFVESIDSKDDDVTPSDADGVFAVNIIFSIAAAVSFVLTYLIIDKGPPTPPSASCEYIQPAASTSYFQSVKLAFRDIHFLTLCLSFGLALGSFNTLATVLNQLLTPYGYDNTETSICSAVSIVAGLVGSGVTGVLIDRTHWYKSVLICWMTIGSTAMLLLYLAIAPDRLALLCLCSGCFGFFILPIMPLCMELGSEMLYPADESLPVGLLVSSGQIFGIGFISFYQYLIDEEKYKLTFFIITACLYLSTGLAGIVGGCKAPLYKRHHYNMQVTAGDAENQCDKAVLEKSDREVQPLLPP